MLDNESWEPIYDPPDMFVSSDMFVRKCLALPCLSLREPNADLPTHMLSPSILELPDTLTLSSRFFPEGVSTRRDRDSMFVICCRVYFVPRSPHPDLPMFQTPYTITWLMLHRMVWR